MNILKHIDELRKKPSPTVVDYPHIDFSDLKQLLSTKVEDVKQEADQAVKKHVLSLHMDDAESWIYQGLVSLGGQDDSKLCPFCEQSIDENQMVINYRSYFNNAYMELKKDIQNVKEKYTSFLDETNISRILDNISVQCQIVESWQSIIPGMETNKRVNSPRVTLTPISTLTTQRLRRVARLAQDSSAGDAKVLLLRESTCLTTVPLT